MPTIELTKDNLDSTIENNDIVFIDFWAEWCGPCKMFGPVFKAASDKYADIVFASCNTEEQQEVAGSFGIRSIPTLAVFREKILIFMQPGALPAAALDEIVGKVKELDMDEVRADIEKQKCEQEEKEKKDE
jgi:thioredoxin 1